MINCSIGICVYNEEKNIGKLLDNLQKQRLKNVTIKEIIIVSSGSTDKTNIIIRNYIKKNSKIKLFVEKKRLGKASAVNLFINKSISDNLVLLSGDVLIRDNTIENLVRELGDCNIGMTGCHPVPINNIDDGFLGFAANLLWELHHRVSLINPKMGEVIAFRKIFKKIPIVSSVDEANIEPLIRGQGYKIKYVSSAIIYNKAPSNIKDFVKQRRRIFCGHLAVKFEQSYEVSTLNIFSIGFALMSFLRDNLKARYILYTPLVILLEAYARFLGFWDYKIAKKRHTVWERIGTTKELRMDTN